MNMHKRAAVAAAAAMLSLTALTSCELIAQHTLPTPDPPKTSAPTESAQERTIRLDKEAAEKAYRSAARESTRLALAGGTTKATKALTDNEVSSYLDNEMEGLRFLHEKGYRADKPFARSVVANQGWSPKEIGLTACEDASKVRLVDKSGKEVMKDRHRRFVQTLTAKKIDGRWKIADVRSKVVKTFRNESGCSNP